MNEIFPSFLSQFQSLQLCNITKGNNFHDITPQVQHRSNMDQCSYKINGFKDWTGPVRSPVMLDI